MWLQIASRLGFSRPVINSPPPTQSHLGLDTLHFSHLNSCYTTAETQFVGISQGILDPYPPNWQGVLRELDYPIQWLSLMRHFVWFSGTFWKWCWCKIHSPPTESLINGWYNKKRKNERMKERKKKKSNSLMSFHQNFSSATVFFLTENKIVSLCLHQIYKIGFIHMWASGSVHILVLNLLLYIHTKGMYNKNFKFVSMINFRVWKFPLSNKFYLFSILLHVRIKC